MRIAHLCETMGCLPNSGGLLDQLPGHIERLDAVFRARRQREHDEVKQQERKSNLANTARGIGDGS